MLREKYIASRTCVSGCVLITSNISLYFSHVIWRERTAVPHCVIVAAQKREPLDHFTSTLIAILMDTVDALTHTVWRVQSLMWTLTIDLFANCKCPTCRVFFFCAIITFTSFIDITSLVIKVMAFACTVSGVNCSLLSLSLSDNFLSPVKCYLLCAM